MVVLVLVRFLVTALILLVVSVLACRCHSEESWLGLGESGHRERLSGCPHFSRRAVLALFRDRVRLD